MKVSKLFHWLYASVMFIPLMIAPIFALAVRSDNNFEPISITTGGYEIRNKYQTNEVNTLNDLHLGNLYHFNSFPFADDTFIDNNNDIYELTLYVVSFENINIDFSEGELNEAAYGNYTSNNNNYLKVYIYWEDGVVNTDLSFTNENAYLDWYFEDTYWDLINFDFYFTDNYTLNAFQNVNTEIYEFYGYPTSSDYNTLEYVYNEGVVYNDTDVGSQMLYTLYNATDKYFNFNEYLGIGNLYNWFQLNVFNGNAPLGFNIFWNLLIYWLLVSIAWLIFDIAMFVPKLAHRWLDKASLE